MQDTYNTNWKRNIALFMAGQGVSLFGSMLVHYAVMWHITLKTQSGFMMTLFTAAGALPMFFISPFGGVWADRYNKKYLINIADAVIAAVTLVMALFFSLGYDYAGLLLTCSVMRAFGQGVQTPAVNALIPELVPQEQLTRVNGINGSVQSLVMFASPMAGGALLAVAPVQTLMFLDVITAVIGISILFFFVKTPARIRKSENDKDARLYFHDIREGLAYIGKHSFVKKFIVLSAVFNIMVAPAAILTPLQVTRDFGDGIWRVFGGISFGPEQRLAAVEVVFFIGMMLGGLVIGAWGGFKNKSHSMALSVSLFGLGAVGLGVITNFWAYLACMCLTGLVMSFFNVPVMAVLQTNVDGAYMGRVFSVLTMMSSLMMPLGMVLWGPLGDVVSIDWLLIGTGAFLFLMGFVFVFDKTLLKAGASV
ncbi:MFS transporter [Clostridium sp. Marseille-P2415]|uniref:MFS transporter n=1 Tax=Clostridium sp. Marseille-P2415 TaxID=1805471 RepID=UPI000988517F|nr:MFS transporter [Clostridium sp. Marseille-P2415]